MLEETEKGAGVPGSPTLRSYSDAVRNRSPTAVLKESRQEQSSGNPVSSFNERKEQIDKSAIVTDLHLRSFNVNLHPHLH